MDQGSTIPDCRRCHRRDAVKLRRQIATDGTNQAGWYCLRCERWAVEGKPFLSHIEIDKILRPFNRHLEDLPILQDLSGAMPCIICGRPAQGHHWAPQAYSEAFGAEWGQWPIAPLCKEHHMLWHRTVTPELAKTAIEEED